MLGEAEGIYQQLSKKAEGFKEIVTAANGNPDKAAMLMVVEQLPTVVEAQAKAISNIKFDKIVVMEGGNSGNNTTAEWLSGITKVLPPLHEFANMAGVKLPATLGNILKEETVQNSQKPASDKPLDK